MARSCAWLGRGCRTSTARVAEICTPKCRCNSRGTSRHERRNCSLSSRARGVTTMAPDRNPMDADFGSPLPPNAAFVISVAARLVGVHEQTLRYYERAGLVEPARSKGRIRLYSLHDLERVRKVASGCTRC